MTTQRSAIAEEAAKPIASMKGKDVLTAATVATGRDPQRLFALVFIICTRLKKLSDFH
jgi:hypothetical protein